MKKLHIYPTSRALRTVSKKQQEENAFLPTLMRMDEFEHRAILIPGYKMVDPLQRIIYLQEASAFEAFETLRVDRELIRFFTKSDAIFKFFEELAQEKVDFSTLAEADAYAEFDTHLSILERLLENYRRILEAEGLTDKMLIPGSYQLNEGFLEGYEEIELYLEGYLSHFELDLLVSIAQKIPLSVHYTTSSFNQKMIECFEAYGIVLPRDSRVSFSLSSVEVRCAEPNDALPSTEVIQVEERYEQISIAFEKIEQLVRSGIDPESIALILPDESIKESFALFDRLHNLNFAMGFDYQKGSAYKRLEALYRHWQDYDRESYRLLERYALPVDMIESLSASQQCDAASFFTLLDRMGLLDSSLATTQGAVWEQGEEQVFEKQRYFLKLFKQENFSLRDWLFLWMKSLCEITLDDIRGGKITVMGVLETRGVQYDAVVIVDFNEGIVPASSAKDQFLNTSVRAFAGLPTQADREALQKQYYKRLLEQADRAVILYCSSENRLPSKFLYELGMVHSDKVPSQLSLLYPEAVQIKPAEDPVVEHFNAGEIVWSASRLKTWLACKRKYYYRYIRRIEARKEEELNEGSFLHHLLDHLYRQRDHYRSVDEMQKAIDQLLDQLLPMKDAKIAYQKLLWREKLKGLMEAEVKRFEAGWRVTARELEAAGEIGGLRFKGRIDRIDQRSQHETTTRIIDYKSGSIQEANKSKNIETLSDFQMSIYDHLLRDRYPNLSLWFMQIFERGRVEEITALEEKNRLLGEHIAKLKQTRGFVAVKCDVMKHCTYCEFALQCERGEYL